MSWGLNWMLRIKVDLTSKIEISSVDPLELLGTNDQNIKMLEHHYKTKIFVRGSNLSIDGDKSEVELVQNIINDMIITMGAGNVWRQCEIIKKELTSE